MPETGWLKPDSGTEGVRWRFGGDWTLAHATVLDRAVGSLKGGAGALTFDLSGLEALDTVGAWLITRAAEQAEEAGSRIAWVEPPADFRPLFERVFEAKPEPLRPERKRVLFVDWLADLGAATEQVVRESADLLAFFGSLVETFVRLAARPTRLRVTSVIFHIERTGLNALPIVGMISFLVGVVLAFQGADQLRRFGAQVFTINMVGISVLREMGILLTAIVVAGRSGSAFTAEIGAMQVNEEVDALRVTGLDPMEVLVAPRVIALVIALPLLTFFADIMGLLGGGIMSVALVDVSFAQYWRLLNNAVGLNTFLVGIIKAPVFAILISLVGCFEGLRVSGSAESVGRLTTRSVVESIFLVIIFDALFSILFSYLGY
ncbi:MAG TPA: MlaE family lipid ABC transporter permease subunit [Dongiaceae bacterium]|nr:MlaE family lipid ABC transporter permease subunit [Dongiaceae bacterium]